MLNVILAASAAGVFRTIGSVLLAVLILLVMVTVHEFGHYLAGKLLKFRIDEFSVGFGPALFKIKSKKTGELFAVRLIPLGGYCAFHGEDGLEDAAKKEDKTVSAEKEKTQEPAQDAVHAAPADEADGSAPAALSAPVPLREEQGATSLSEDGQTEDKPTEERLTEDGQSENEAPVSAPKPKKRDWKDGGTFTDMKPWKRIIVLVAGACMNYLLAFVLLLISMAAYGQTLIGVRYVAPTEDISAEFCLQERDVFLKADGVSLYLTTDLARALNGKKAGDVIEMEILRVVNEVKGTDKEGNETTQYVRERMKVRIQVREDVKVKNSSDLDGVWRGLGVQYMEPEEEGGAGYYAYGTHVQRFGFFETIGRSFVYSFKIAGSIFKIIGELLTGHIGINAIGGPVTTIATTSKVASQSFRSFLEIAGFIGVNLAVFNLLPIPALDGSKVVFTVIEWIRGVPISRKVEAIIHAVGFVLLIGFAVLVDLLQFVL